ncbi:MAG: AAA family ATPase, partial [Candidatus Pacearchaeota archaeon]|nr:AAA family ATPase [Candidatus Pacearchaeota archaeon]
MESEIWTEKFRPSRFSDVVGQEEIIKRVEALTNSLNIPHFLFAGPAGTGKSTLALIIVKELFKENWKENYLELNASDERGIQIVREKVKNFARTKSLGSVPFKVIFLDEADALTPEAQQALRRTMENYSATCRFILSVNYSSKVIDPIQSRCVLFRFKILEKKDIERVIKKIAETENLTIDQNSIEAL